MPISIGLKTNTHIFICTESILAESILKIKENAEFVSTIGNTFLCVTGEQGNAFRLASLTIELSKIYSIKYRAQISPSLVANTLQKETYDRIRKGGFQCSAIVGGMGTDDLELYCVDPYGAKHQDNFVVTGYGLYFLYGLYDACYSEDMGEEEAIHFLRICVKALKDRMVLDTSKWMLNVVDKEGRKTCESFELQ